MSASQHPAAPTERRSARESGTAQLDALKKQELADGMAEEDGHSEYVTVRWR